MSSADRFVEEEWSSFALSSEDEKYKPVFSGLSTKSLSRIAGKVKDCGTGEGGFKPGNECAGGGRGSRSSKPKPTAKTKSEIAKASAKRVDAEIQRYAEEVNEAELVKMIGGTKLDDSEPMDVISEEFGVELKTMVSNKANKLTMKKSAMDAKSAWEKKTGLPASTVVFDDTGVFNAKGEGKHDPSKRRILVRRGYGSFRVGSMHEVKDVKELKALLTMPDDKLPPAAKRPVVRKKRK